MKSYQSNLEEYRDQFPVTEKYTFMNHAAVSAPPIRTVHAVSSLYREFSTFSTIRYSTWMERIEEIRKHVAKLINSSAEEIAFTGNTSEGLAIVSNGLKWKSKDTIIVPKPEFPANVYPWMNLKRYGVQLKFLKRKSGKFGVKEISKLVDGKTKMIALSSVDYLSGFCCDLEEIGDYCDRKGVLFCVDAIQGLGVIPVDVKKYKIHFLSAGGHKWLLGVMGCGFLYISSAVNNLIHPDRVGWKSVVNEEDFHNINFKIKKNALGFETGSMNIAGIYALGTSLEILLEAGIEEIYNRVLSLTDQLHRGLLDRGYDVLTPMGIKERSGIITFSPFAYPDRLFKYLIKNDTLLSLRSGLIRISPHFYNNDDDVKRFFDVLDEFDKQ